MDPHTTYDVPKEYWSLYYKGNYAGGFGRDVYFAAVRPLVDQKHLYPPARRNGSGRTGKWVRLREEGADE